MAEVSYYWNAYSTAWDTNPAYMTDGILTNYASTSTDNQKQKLLSTTCPGTDLGTITKVELRCYGYGDGDDRIDLAFDLSMSPEYQLTMPATAGWSTYADVTDDPYVGGWTWAKVKQLVTSDRLLVEFDKVAKGNTMYCAKGEIRVTYTPEAPPGYPYKRRTLKGNSPYSGRRGFDEVTGHRRGFWPA